MKQTTVSIKTLRGRTPTKAGDKRKELTDRLEHDMEAAGLPRPIKEYQFHKTRKWRFDYAFLVKMIAVEVDGGLFTRGRHQRPFGVVGDNEKLNEAARLGWTVLRFTRMEIMGGRVKKGTRKGCGLIGYCKDGRNQCRYYVNRHCNRLLQTDLPVYEDAVPAVETIKRALKGESDDTDS